MKQMTMMNVLPMNSMSVPNIQSSMNHGTMNVNIFDLFSDIQNETPLLPDVSTHL